MKDKSEGTGLRHVIGIGGADGLFEASDLGVSEFLKLRNGAPFIFDPIFRVKMIIGERKLLKLGDFLSKLLAK